MSGNPFPRDSHFGKQIEAAMAQPIARVPHRQLVVDQPKASKPRPRHTPGKMNQMESAFAQELELRKRAGEILSWEFESVKFRLADRCWFTCDFMLHMPNGEIHFVDVKGWKAEDDAIVKIKVAAERFKMFRFAFATKTKNGWVWRPF